MDPEHIQVGRKAAEILGSWGYPDAGDKMRRGMDAAEAEGRPAAVSSTARRCARNACQRPGATFWNSSTRDWYCRRCALAINEHAPGLCQEQ